MEYIGSSINLPKRKTDHFCRLRLGTHANRNLQDAYNSGVDLTFEILETCSKEELVFLEDFYIKDALKVDILLYNSTANAINPMLDEHNRAKLSKKYSLLNEVQVIEILRKIMEGIPNKSLSITYNVAPHVIKDIKTGKSNKRLHKLVPGYVEWLESYLKKFNHLKNNTRTTEELSIIKSKLANKKPYRNIAKEHNISTATLAKMKKEIKNF